MASIQLYALLWFFFPPSTLYHFLYSISLPHVLTRHSSCFSDVLPRVLISFVTPYEPSYIHLFYAHFLSQSPSLFPVLRLGASFLVQTKKFDFGSSRSTITSARRSPCS